MVGWVGGGWVGLMGGGSVRGWVRWVGSTSDMKI